ncbi:hypothetical protein SAMN06265375_103233 [Muriicola jejuensis]|uniref:Uncharacterized protein n=1 Tax=Muriicola jejuensis TaxID=504488 RepID=A0A6P0UHV1_9FLAO|nr:hypothetical protein [Muriicola jejuensis]NER11408.1 hypothetical protein [Muriicola jejuensis]SMP20906.1 hypothetical protein SAMN06265375_103233 [Muriicola jejuensis]
MGITQRSSLLCLILGVLFLSARTNAALLIREDPIEVSKKVIADDPSPWNEAEYRAIREEIGPIRALGEMEKNYLLLQSPWLGTEYLQGVYEEGVNSIPVEQLLDLLNLATNSPVQTSRKLAEISLQQALLEYEKAFAIAANLKSDSSVAYEDGIVFLQNRFGYLKMQTAKKLLNESGEVKNVGVDKKISKKITDRFRSLRKKYADEIPLSNALEEIKAFYTLLEEVVSGLALVKPYTEFTQTITELNEVQLRERKHWRSGLEITYPSKGSVWTIPDPASIQWTSENLPAEKTIKFYLLRNNTVIQELGTFKNNSLAEGIRLNTTLPAGNNYRVMGIELFPADKFHTAKFASPYFTIEKRDPNTPPPADEIILAKETQPEPEPEVTVVEEVVEVIEPVVEDEVISMVPEEEIEEVTEEVETAVEEEITEAVMPEKRTDFDGRTITYVKELEVNSRIIQINLWDHGRQDGDIVSIYLNGYPIVSKYNLTYQKKGFELNLDPSQPNDLFLYAHNLGRFPPNTVSIEIIDGETSENIILNSDLSQCEAVLINVKE